MAQKHTSGKGSSIAKSGFNNEQSVVEEIKNWKTSSFGQELLESMGYNLSKIEYVEAYLAHHAIQSLRIKIKGNAKADVQIRIRVKLKDLIDVQNISVKLVSSKNGFNQIDKRWVSSYKELWNISYNIEKLLQYFTGELPSSQYKSSVKHRDSRRLYFTEMTNADQELVKLFFQKNKVLIVSDVIKGRGILSAEWLLVVQKYNDAVIWKIVPINKALQIFSQGDVFITKKGNLSLGAITMQRKGGDGGRKTAQMLQFKCNPLKIFDD